MRVDRCFFGVLAAVTVSLAAGGCASWSPRPEMAAIYDRAAQHDHIGRNPVIVIPGILGSRLVDPDSGAVVWGAFAGEYANPDTAAGARLIAMPMRQGAALRDLDDGVEPDGALDRLQVSLFGLPVKLNAYINILKTLGVGGYRDELLGTSKAVDYGPDHYTCFQFDYDWRRDNVENAQRLHRFILEKRAYVQRELEKRFGVAGFDVRFDIVAHSMGGLLTRYYLRYGDADLPADGSLPQVTWAGAEHVERAILVGTPSAGSVKSMEQLVQGVRFAPVLPAYPAAVLGTMPSVYQLLPRARHRAVIDSDSGSPVGRVLDPALWREAGWGLASPDQAAVLRVLLPEVESDAQQRAIALDHQAKCLRRAEWFQAAIDVPATPPVGLKLCLFSGDAEPTAAVMLMKRDTGAAWVTETAPGDGTVLRSSALMDERLGGEWSPRLKSPIRWHRVGFVFADHLGMTADPQFTDSVLYLLLEDPR